MDKKKLSLYLLIAGVALAFIGYLLKPVEDDFYAEEEEPGEEPPKKTRAKRKTEPEPEIIDVEHEEVNNAEKETEGNE